MRFLEFGKKVQTALVAGALLSCSASLHAVELSFFFPVAVGGPVTKIVDGLAADFEKEHPGITVKPIYAGSYQDTVAKALTAIKGGDAPQLSVILSTDTFTLIDEDAIVAFDELVSSPEDRAWLKSFFPAFMENGQVGGKTWGVPFQRSTPVLYYNKDAFWEAGLDPEKAPATWDEMVSMGQKLTKRDASGNVTQWGVQIPSSGFPYWLFQGLATQNDVRLMNSEGNETYFDDPRVIEALQYWVDLSMKHKVHPPGIVEWGTTPKDFFERKVAMMWTTTGNLTNVRKNAPFDFGVAMLPANKRRGAPTGGGNFFIFKNSTAEQKAAALKLVRWMTSPERAAEWSIKTGYVATSPDAWQTPVMKEYVAGFSAAAVARDQLQHAVAELSTHENQRVVKAFNDGLQAALTGSKSAEDAMKEAQRTASRILRSYR
jgi:sn-glycerol 3-phosphate transport system substrate-binding protein